MRSTNLIKCCIILYFFLSVLYLLPINVSHIMGWGKQKCPTGLLQAVCQFYTALIYAITLLSNYTLLVFLVPPWYNLSGPLELFYFHSVFFQISCTKLEQNIIREVLSNLYNVTFHFPSYTLFPLYKVLVIS